jgi:hypothetical protein
MEIAPDANFCERELQLRVEEEAATERRSHLQNVTVARHHLVKNRVDEKAQE